MLRWVVGLGFVLACAGCGDDDEGSGGAGGEAAGGGGAGGSGGAGGALPDVDLDGTVEAYGYAFDVETGAATSTLTVAVESDGNCFVVPDALSPASASMNGAPAEALLDGEMLRICGPEHLAAGDSLELVTSQTVPRMTYLGLDVGFDRYDNLAGGTFSYLLSWVGGCDRFGPCDDATDRLVRFSFDVQHPPDTTVLCPGTLTPGTGQTRCELSGPTLAPTYSGFAVAADTDWQRSELVSGGGMTLVLYETPPGPLAGALDPVRVGHFLDWVTGQLGPYPYGDEIRVASGPTRWLGFEHPANIVLHEQLPALQLPFGDATMHVLAHEIVHQWAGDRTTLASRADFVWKEAIAEYLAYVYAEDHGPLGAADTTRKYWDDIASDAAYHPRPTDEPTPAVESFYGDVYGPGPMVLFVQLEPWLGRAAVLDAIRSFLSEPGARSVSELQAALQAESSVDLGPYFDTWVYGSGAPSWPEIAVSTAAAGGNVELTLSFTDGVPRPCVVEVDLVGATTTVTATLDFGPDPQASSAMTTVPMAEPVTSTLVDPRHRLVQAAPPGAARRSRKAWIF